MKVIWKFNLRAAEMPKGAKVLSVGFDPLGMPCVWAIVDPKAPAEPSRIKIIGTGDPVPAGEYIGRINDGPFVWHIFLEAIG